MCYSALGVRPGRILERADLWENMKQPLSTPTAPTMSSPSFLMYCVLGGRTVRPGPSSSMVSSAHFSRALFTFYLLINKAKGRSCLFPAIKNCTHNWSLSSPTSAVSLCFSQCFWEIRGNRPDMMHDRGGFAIFYKLILYSELWIRGGKKKRGHHVEPKLIFFFWVKNSRWMGLPLVVQCG